MLNSNTKNLMLTREQYSTIMRNSHKFQRFIIVPPWIKEKIYENEFVIQDILIYAKMASILNEDEFIDLMIAQGSIENFLGNGGSGSSDAFRTLDSFRYKQ